MNTIRVYLNQNQIQQLQAKDRKVASLRDEIAKLKAQDRTEENMARIKELETHLAKAGEERAASQERHLQASTKSEALNAMRLLTWLIRFAMLPVYTFSSRKPGMYHDTGSKSWHFPCSYSIISAVQITGLVMEKILKIPSKGIGIFGSDPRRPYAL